MLGARALSVNLSDIAAMGGVPTACVVNLAIRSGLGSRFFDRLYAGLAAAATAAGVDIVGGNVTSADALAITITLIGDAREAVLRRDRARSGDEVSLPARSATRRSDGVFSRVSSSRAHRRVNSWSIGFSNRIRN